MADDIVTRLREKSYNGCKCIECEAADEIERLRHLLNEVNALHGTDEYENWCRHCEQMWPCPTVRLLQSEEDGRG